MLRTLTRAALLIALTATGSVALAEEYIPPEPEARGVAADASAIVCSACHGSDGKAILGEYPNLGGQHYEYLLRQMRAFKGGDRYAVLMAGQLDALSDDALKNLAAYYAEGTEVEQVAPAGADLELGERIWRAGIAEQGLPACAACHGPSGAGNGPAGFPTLSGQNAGYTALQLRAYRDGTRATDEAYGQMMRGVAAAMSDADIEAVAAFAQGVR